MAALDLDAMIRVALEETNSSQLYYVGHSQGTITMFAKLAADAAFNKKVSAYEPC